MAIAVAQTVAGIEASVSGTLTASATTTTGNMLVCVATVDFGNTISGIADSAGNTWAEVTSDVTTSAPIYMWKTTNASPAGGSPNVVTITLGSSDAATMRVYEISGASNNSSAEVSSSAHKTASATAVNSGTTTIPLSALDLGIGAMAWQHSSTLTVSPTFTNGTGTDHNDVTAVFGTNFVLESSSRVMTGAAAGQAYSGTLSGTPTSASWAAIIALFKAQAATVPDAPTIGTATAGNESGSVTFTAPGNNGGAAITSYTVTCTSSNGGAAGSNSGASSPIVVLGLSPGKLYTATVKATNSVGDSAASAASNSFVPHIFFRFRTPPISSVRRSMLW